MQRAQGLRSPGARRGCRARHLVTPPQPPATTRKHVRGTSSRTLHQSLVPAVPQPSIHHETAEDTSVTVRRRCTVHDHGNGPLSRTHTAPVARNHCLGVGSSTRRPSRAGISILVHDTPAAMARGIIMHHVPGPTWSPLDSRICISVRQNHSVSSKPDARLHLPSRGYFGTLHVPTSDRVTLALSERRGALLSNHSQRPSNQDKVPP